MIDLHFSKSGHVKLALVLAYGLVAATGCNSATEVAADRGQQAQSQQFMRAAIEAGYDEIVMGQLARERANSEDVKDFAQTLIDDHGESNEMLTQIAQERHIDIPDFHRPADDKNADLATLNGRAFSQRYLSIQVEAHEKAIRDFQGFIETTKDDKLKDFAEDTLPKLRDHLEQAQSLAGKAGSGE